MKLISDRQGIRFVPLHEFKLKVGDKVQWEGKTSTKTGIVKAVVPTGEAVDPHLERLAQLYNAATPQRVGQPRDCESYVVLVRPLPGRPGPGGLRRKRRARLYWPRVARLRRL